MSLRAGDRVGGRFTVEALLGEGGTAQVYRVRHSSLGSLHALKLMHPDSLVSPARLLQEGQIQATLRHPCVVPVTDVVEEEGRPGLVMEYIPGPSLAEVLSRRALPEETSLALFARVLAGVGAAHAAGVLHRDLKPGNVLLAPMTGGWLPKVADFGIALPEGPQTGPRRTRVGFGIGTPGYMAPEQARGSREVDRRADVYALGVVLYELLTGELPGSDEPGAAPADPAAARARLGPGPIGDAVGAALAVDAVDRPADVAAFAELLYAALPELRAVATGRVAPGPVPIPGEESLADGSGVPGRTSAGATIVVLPGEGEEEPRVTVAPMPTNPGSGGRAPTGGAATGGAESGGREAGGGETGGTEPRGAGRGPLLVGAAVLLLLLVGGGAWWAGHRAGSGTAGGGGGTSEVGSGDAGAALSPGEGSGGAVGASSDGAAGPLTVGGSAVPSGDGSGLAMGGSTAGGVVPGSAAPQPGGSAPGTSSAGSASGGASGVAGGAGATGSPAAGTTVPAAPAGASGASVAAGSASPGSTTGGSGTGGSGTGGSGTGGSGTGGSASGTGAAPGTAGGAPGTTGGASATSLAAGTTGTTAGSSTAPEGGAAGAAGSGLGASAVAPSYPNVKGSWMASISGRPVEVRITGQDGARVTAQVVFTLGTTDRSFRYVGKVDEAGAIRLAEDGGVGVLVGTVKDGMLMGTLTTGSGKPQAIQARKQ